MNFFSFYLFLRYSAYIDQVSVPLPISEFTVSIALKGEVGKNKQKNQEVAKI